MVLASARDLLLQVLSLPTDPDSKIVLIDIILQALPSSDASLLLITKILVRIDARLMTHLRIGEHRVQGAIARLTADGYLQEGSAGFFVDLRRLRPSVQTRRIWTAQEHYDGYARVHRSVFRVPPLDTAASVKSALTKLNRGIARHFSAAFGWMPEGVEMDVLKSDYLVWLVRSRAGGEMPVISDFLRAGSLSAWTREMTPERIASARQGLRDFRQEMKELGIG